jgi:hypothetical protein
MQDAGRFVACILVSAAVMLGTPSAGAAQDCFPGPASNEARTLALFAVSLAFSRGSAPDVYPGIKAGVELTYLPRVSDEKATPTICRPGKGPEHANLLIGMARPRLTLPLPFGLQLQASWVPPVRVNGVKANLVGVSIEKVFGHLDGIVASVRGHATFGSIHAPVTCDDARLSDPASECYGGTRSDDRISPNILGVELAVGGSMDAGRLRPYGGAGYNRLQPHFQVNFTNRFGEVDRRRVEVDLNRLVVFGGATWQVAGRMDMSGEIYAAPADAMTGRVIMRMGVGP